MNISTVNFEFWKTMPQGIGMWIKYTTYTYSSPLRPGDKEVSSVRLSYLITKQAGKLAALRKVSLPRIKQKTVWKHAGIRTTLYLLLIDNIHYASHHCPLIIPAQQSGEFHVMVSRVRESHVFYVVCNYCFSCIQILTCTRGNPSVQRELLSNSLWEGLCSALGSKQFSHFVCHRCSHRLIATCTLPRFTHGLVTYPTQRGIMYENIVQT